jgi:cell filamentation protein
LTNRYEAIGDEDEFEPGSDGRVLRNRVGIQNPQDMDALEMRLLGELYEDVLIRNFPDREITAADLKHWHRMWLGNVYSWAGEERSVNLGKDGFQFATARLIPELLRSFERRCLSRWTRGRESTCGELAEAIAITHVELILIHPFRDGNGRLARLLADVMAAQAGQDLLDYTEWEEQRAEYVAAIHAGVAGDYAPMTKMVTAAMKKDGAALTAPR